MNLRLSVSSFAILAIAHLANAGQDPTEIIQAADKAGKALKSAEYTLEGSFSYAKVKASTWQVNATVPDTGFAVGKYRVKCTSESGGDLEYFDFAYDGKALRVRSGNDDVRMVKDPDAYAAGQQIPPIGAMCRMPVIGGWQWLLDLKPQMRVLPAKKIGSWTCDVVEVKYVVNSPVVGDTKVEVEWAFDRVSHLPIQRASATSTVTLLKLKVNPVIDDKIFKLEGKEIDAKGELPATADLLALGSMAPNFSLKDADGKVRTLKSYRGKVVVLDFWGTWCVPCRKTMPILQKLQEQYKGAKVAVLGISVDREMDPAAFMRRMKYNYPIGLDGAKAAKDYKAVMLPTTYVIDAKGKIVFRQAGIDRNDAVRLPSAVASALKG